MGNYHVRFGGGPTEKGPRGHLAGGLPYNNGTDSRWLELVQPELAVASVAANNDYGHPGSQTLALLERSRTPLLCTDRDGSIRIVSDGRRWRVEGRQVATRSPPTEKLARAPGRDSKRRSVGRPVNINTASEEELEALPRIGPVIARRIIEGRPYRSVDDLRRVKGLGPKRLDEIRPLATTQ